MRVSIIHLFLLSLVLLSCYSQNIVDFTYTQLDQKQGKTSRQTPVINIKPDRQIIQGYTFPEACYLAEKLEEQKIEDSRNISSYDLDTMIDVLKGDFIQLLKTSEKIKMKKANIQELWQMTGKSSNVTIIPKRDLDAIKAHQDKLVQIDNNIKKKSQQLDDQVKNSNLITENNQFALNSVNFEIQSLRLKIDYLRVLRRSSNDADAKKSKDQYEKYFNDLKNKFGQQNELIGDLALILNGYNQFGSVRASIQHLKSKIQVTNILIDEKETCVRQRDQIKNFQKNDHQIKSMMANLRLKKREKTNINNKYCEGVTAKLLDRVKKVLLSYNYTFECAQGLDQIIRQRNRDRQQLIRLEKRFKQLQNENVDQYKKKFDDTRIYIKNKQQQLSKFSIPSYFHDIQELDRLIQKSEKDLQQASQRKKKLSVPASPSKEIDYRKIQDLVAAIKKLKGTYCVEYEKYDKGAHQLWRRIQKYQIDHEYTTKIKGIYEGEVNQLKQLEASFQILRSKILERIK